MKPLDSLASFQQTVAIALAGLALVHVPVLTVLAWMFGFDSLRIGLIAFALAALPGLMLLMGRPVIAIAAALAIALVAQTSLLVYLMQGHPWQVETHFYYFAVLAMLSGFCDMRILLLAAGVIAIQHLGFNYVLPAALYPGGSNLGRVLLHAFVVVVETVMLIGIGWTIRSAFRQAEEARKSAESSAAELNNVLDDRVSQLTDTRHRADRVERTLRSFEDEMTLSVEILHEAASLLNDNADKLAATSARANAQTVTAIETSEQTSTEVRLAAQAGDELAQTIEEVETNASQSLDLAVAAVAEAVTASTAIDQLAVVAEDISRVTDLISAIASQRNLLALNATIEAARAGEYGRGFAVVAQEVKELAGQTAGATREIAQRIGAIQTSTSKSVQAMQSVTRTIRELDRSQGRIAAAVKHQANATREIAGNVNSAALGVRQVSAAIAKIEQEAAETAIAAARFTEAARKVSSQSGTIRGRVRSFTDEIHNATQAGC